MVSRTASRSAIKRGYRKERTKTKKEISNKRLGPISQVLCGGVGPRTKLKENRRSKKSRRKVEKKRRKNHTPRPAPVLGLVPGSDGSSLCIMPTFGSGIWMSSDIYAVLRKLQILTPSLAPTSRFHLSSHASTCCKCRFTAGAPISSHNQPVTRPRAPSIQFRSRYGSNALMSSSLMVAMTLRNSCSGNSGSRISG